MDGNEFIDNMIEKDIVKLIREFTDIKNRDNIRAIINLVKRFREMESGKQ